MTPESLETKVTRIDTLMGVTQKAVDRIEADNASWRSIFVDKIDRLLIQGAENATMLINMDKRVDHLERTAATKDELFEVSKKTDDTNFKITKTAKVIGYGVSFVVITVVSKVYQLELSGLLGFLKGVLLGSSY